MQPTPPMMRHFAPTARASARTRTSPPKRMPSFRRRRRSRMPGRTRTRQRQPWHSPWAPPPPRPRQKPLSRTSGRAIRIPRRGLVLGVEGAALSPPGGRRLTRHLPKDLAEVSLIGHAARQRDIAQGIVGHQHQVTRFFNSAAKHVGVRADPEGLLECPCKMRLASLYDGTEVRNQDPRAEVSIDVVIDSPNLPAEQCAASVPRGIALEILVDLHPEERGGA